jgi:hypothetical protein
MGRTARLSKLAELRAKTDRELAKVIDMQLERALHLARHPDNYPDSLKLARVQAEDICAEAVGLLTKVEDPHSREQLETKFNVVRQRLKAPADAGRRRWASAYC